MALINDVKRICDRLAPLGWHDLLLTLTNGALDIQQLNGASLTTALTAPLQSIDRNRDGFDDFHRSANRAITPGQPAHSLLYHALASPGVHPTQNNQPSPNGAGYATLDELDTLENFIYSLAASRQDLDDTFIAVFAYQYRRGSRTTHLRHADLAFSRTGVARVGTAAYNYDASRRGFWIIPENNEEELAVLPARYGVFLARRARPGVAGSIQGKPQTAREQFLFPVHKLFDGRECLAGQNLSVDFLEYHRNEKLHRTHALSVADGGLPVPPGFDTDSLPYIRDSINGGDLVSLQRVGTSVLLVPTPHATLVRMVAQTNSITNKDQIVHFIVPPEKLIIRPNSPGSRSTRFETSTLEIPAFGADRLAPEYVNIRHRIDPTGPLNQIPVDLDLLLVVVAPVSALPDIHSAVIVQPVY
jgi:hypothetical protein